MGKYLDKVGLQALWNALKGKCVLIDEDGGITFTSNDGSSKIHIGKDIFGYVNFSISSKSEDLNTESSLSINSFFGLTGLQINSKDYILAVGEDGFSIRTKDNENVLIFRLNLDGEFIIGYAKDTYNAICSDYVFNFDKAVELGILSVKEDTQSVQTLNLESMSADELAKLSPSQIRKMSPSQLAKAVKIVSESRASGKSDAQAQVTT